MKALFFAEKTAHLDDAAGLSETIKLDELYALVLGKPENKNYTLFKKIYYIDEDKTITTESVAKILEKIYDEISPELLIGPATKNGNDVLSRVATAKGIPMITEISGLELQDSQKIIITRTIFAGRATTTYEASPPLAFTIPLKKFTLSKEPEMGCPIEKIDLKEIPKTKIVEVKEKAKEAVNIEEAEIVIGVGRGFKRKEDLRLAEELAELLNGVVGCTRPIAADYGWLSEDRWIGISGKKIRPKLYLAIGISGAPQHMSAVMDSKIIVAVNKDKNAPIFQYTDYGVVADLYKFIPILIEKIKAKIGK